VHERPEIRQRLAFGGPPRKLETAAS
jgi:hypothetical protein